MNEHRKSDGPAVPMKAPNNAGKPVAEEPEGRGPAKGNLLQQNAPRTQRRPSAPSALERIRLAAARDGKMRFTALLHHVCDLPMLRAAYLNLKREAAAGVDGETWRHYGERLEENLRDLAERVKRGAYRAKPVRRVYIPKADVRILHVDGPPRSMGLVDNREGWPGSPRANSICSAGRILGAVFLR
jgi:hypothetical protein